MYSKPRFGIELKKLLNNNTSIIGIARWSEKIFFDHCREIPPELDDVIMALSSMEHGEEFELSQQELYLLVEMLINNEIDPIGQIRKIANHIQQEPSLQNEL